mmetsp:Transcript_20113/g.51012  ORF Transcript_20113/g.51012 Transcript_20113/m.51012 type:complete len:328 (-) Transcript_20113:99-1082(-)
MGRKKKKQQKPFCWYCDREFNDEKVLIDHQRAKHFKCSVCHKKLTSATGLSLHLLQVHKITITTVPNALPGKDSLEYEIYGMEGIPEEGNPSKKQKTEESVNPAVPSFAPLLVQTPGGLLPVVNLPPIQNTFPGHSMTPLPAMGLPGMMPMPVMPITPGTMPSAPMSTMPSYASTPAMSTTMSSAPPPGSALLPTPASSSLPPLSSTTASFSSSASQYAGSLPPSQAQQPPLFPAAGMHDASAPSATSTSTGAPPASSAALGAGALGGAVLVFDEQEISMEELRASQSNYASARMSSGHMPAPMQGGFPYPGAPYHQPRPAYSGRGY